MKHSLPQELSDKKSEYPYSTIGKRNGKRPQSAKVDIGTTHKFKSSRYKIVKNLQQIYKDQMRPPKYNNLSSLDACIKDHQLRNNQSNQYIPKSVDDASPNTVKGSTQIFTRSHANESNMIRHSLAVSNDVDKIINR
jgi:hypothetical protein